MTKLMNQDLNLHKIIIFSDGDHASWNDFNWELLRQKNEVYFVNLANPIADRGNIYIDSIALSSDSTGTKTQWTVTLSRSGKSTASRGKIVAKVDDQILKESECR